jgi:SAM-dependent methyltransferase
VLRIGFLTTLGVNVGDEFIREGIRAVLDATGVPYTPLYVNKHDPASLWRPAEDETIRTADKFWSSDVFIQAGAPVYWHFSGGRVSSVTSEWHGWMWEQRILADENPLGGPRPEFLNLGAGSCQPYEDRGASFVNDPACASFARAAGSRAAWTTVRDPIAAEMLRSLGVEHTAIACPAFLAGGRHRSSPADPGLIGVNLMKLGAHWDLDERFDAAGWQAFCLRLCHELRRLGRLVFICHDAAEREFSLRFAQPDERMFLAPTWREYFDVYAACGAVVANRIHGAVCAAGFGVPGLILGNDTRARIGDYVGLPVHRSGAVPVEEVVTQVRDFLRRRSEHSERLLTQRDRALRAHVEKLEPLLRARLAGSRSPVRRGTSAARILDPRSAADGRANESLAQMLTLLRAHGVTHPARPGGAWHLPLLWDEVALLEGFPPGAVFDADPHGSELTWVLVARGAAVTLPVRTTSVADGVAGELPAVVRRLDIQSLESASCDLVISIDSVRSADGPTFLRHAARVLKPGGWLVAAVDLCERSLGMTYPHADRQPWSLADWRRAFSRPASFLVGHGIELSLGALPQITAAHAELAPHHHYAVAAVLLRRA